MASAGCDLEQITPTWEGGHSQRQGGRWLLPGLSLCPSLGAVLGSWGPLQSQLVPPLCVWPSSEQCCPPETAGSPSRPWLYFLTQQRARGVWESPTPHSPAARGVRPRSLTVSSGPGLPPWTGMCEQELVRTYMLVRVCAHACTCVHEQTCICVMMRVHVTMCVYVYIFVSSENVCACLCAYVSVYTSLCVHVCLSVCAHVCA